MPSISKQPMLLRSTAPGEPPRINRAFTDEYGLSLDDPLRASADRVDPSGRSRSTADCPRRGRRRIARPSRHEAGRLANLALARQNRRRSGRGTRALPFRRPNDDQRRGAHVDAEVIAGRIARIDGAHRRVEGRRMPMFDFASGSGRRTRLGRSRPEHAGRIQSRRSGSPNRSDSRLLWHPAAVLERARRCRRHFPGFSLEGSPRRRGNRWCWVVLVRACDGIDWTRRPWRYGPL